MHLIHDRQTEFAPVALEVWDSMKEHKALGWHKMGDLTFSDERRYEPLDLADMYAI